MIAGFEPIVNGSITIDMSLGAEKTQTTVYQGDTAELFAYFFDASEAALAQADFASVSFTIRDPDGVDTTVPGIVLADGSCFYRFSGTTTPGLHKWTAQATLVTGEIRTYRDEFYVEDPLADPPESWSKQITDEVWMRLEDCFDSELGGPYLRDATLAYFEPNKVERFIAEGLMLINITPPTTVLDLSYFTTPIINTDPSLPVGTTQPDPDRILIVQATLLSIIRHLMRSYVEQPDPQGANIVWMNRRDYLQRWQTIYTLELDAFNRMVLLWKRQFYNFGQGALSVHSKAGRLYPTGWRARNVSRGYT